MAEEVLLNLAAEIVTAHVSNNSVATGDLPNLIQSVYNSLAGLGKEVEAPPVKQDPAVSIRSSVKADAIACLECGQKLKMLKRHLGIDHGTTPAEYRAKWNLPSDYPMVAPDYAAKRRDLAKKIGLGRKPGQKVMKKTVSAANPARRGKASPATTS